MARTQASLPAPSRIGFFTLLLVICALILVNSILTTGVFQLIGSGRARWLTEPRLAQPLLFLAPLLLLSLELWLGSAVSRFCFRANARR